MKCDICRKDKREHTGMLCGVNKVCIPCIAKLVKKELGK